MSEIKIPIQKESAEIWRRLIALVYDAFILLAISMGFGTVAVIVSSLLGNKPDDSYTPVVNGNITFALWYLVLAAFYYYFWRKDGQTLGMRAWRLRLVTWQGEVAPARSCIVRVLISPPLIGLFLIAYFWKLIDKDKLCLHDRLSKTKVVVIAKHK